MLPPYSRSVLSLKLHLPCQPLFQGCQVEDPESNGLCGPSSFSILNLNAVSLTLSGPIIPYCPPYYHEHLLSLLVTCE